MWAATKISLFFDNASLNLPLKSPILQVPISSLCAVAPQYTQNNLPVVLLDPNEGNQESVCVCLLSVSLLIFSNIFP